MESEKPKKNGAIKSVPEDWAVKSIGDVCDLLTGFPFKGNLYTDNEGIRVLRGENVSIGFLRWDTIKRWKYSTNGLEKYFLKKGDIVIGMDGSRVGKNRAQIQESDLPLLLAQRVACLRAKEKIDQDFLSHVILDKPFEKYVELIQTGTSVPHISGDQIKALKLAVPPYIEQEGIASILSSINLKIRVNQQINRILEAIGKAIFKRWFVDFEFPNEEGKPYKSSGGEMVYNSQLDKEIPAKWAAKEIGELAKINEHSINRDFKYSEIEYIDIDSVDKGIIRNRQILQLTDAPSRAKRIVKNNDTIISTVRPNLKHFALIQDTKPNTIVSTGFAVISPMNGNSKFLYYHLTADKYTNYLSAIADSHTSTYPSFNPDVIQKSVVAYPDENKQQVTTNSPSQFDLIMEALFYKVENSNKQIWCLSQLRDTLLPKFMYGRIRVPIQKENMEAP